MLLITVFCVFMGAIAIMSRMSMLTYYVIYVVGSFTMIAPIFTSVTVGQLIGSLLLPVGTRIFGKRNLLLLMNVVMVICFVIMFVIPANNSAFLIIISLIIGVTGASANVCTGMLSDCIEYGDWKYGIREAGYRCGRFRDSSSAGSFRICAQRGADRGSKDRHQRGCKPGAGGLHRDLRDPAVLV